MNPIEIQNLSANLIAKFEQLKQANSIKLKLNQQNSNFIKNYNQNNLLIAKQEIPIFIRNLSSKKDQIIKLLNWFKSDYFQWVNNPVCCSCKSTKTILLSTESASIQESYFDVSRTEIYKCSDCFLLTRFPRYKFIC